MGWTFSTGDVLLAAFLGCAGYQCAGALPPCERLGRFPCWFCGDDDEAGPVIRQSLEFYRRAGYDANIVASRDVPIRSRCRDDELHLVGILEASGAPDQLLLVRGDLDWRFDAIDYIVNVLLPTAVTDAPSARRRALTDRRN